MGESYGAHKVGLDELVMPYIDMANLACGFHGGDPHTMQQSIALAKKHSVTIGAHPSYPDLVGFGRRSMKCSSDELESIVLYQIAALDGMCKAQGVQVSYIKPHGAMYNDMMQDSLLFEAIVKAIARYTSSLKLMILSTVDNKTYETIALKHGITLLYEVFGDRAYTSDGYLVPRSYEGALLHSSKEVKERLKQLQTTGTISAIDGTTLALKVDTLCVHGDNKEALSLVKALCSL